MLLIFAEAGVLSFVISGLSIPLARRFGVLDAPGAIKVQTTAVPRLGGLGIITAVLLTWALAPVGTGRLNLWGVLASGAVMAAVGLLDDIHGLSPWQKLAGQLVAGVALGLFGVRLGVAHQGWINVVVTSLLVALGANSVNLLDGLDGIAAGTSAVMAGAFALLLFDHSHAGLALAVAGACIGFLPWNWHPAKTFMGDGGSLFLGFSVALLLILTVNGHPWQYAAGGLMVVAVPALDMSLSVLRRLLHRQPVYAGDRNHMYDRLHERGLNQRLTALTLWGVAALTGVAGFETAQASSLEAVLYFASFVGTAAIIAWKLDLLK